ncbi:OmpW family protein [Ramlibacter sp. WS9]|uniref:OmpW/AlkL family protein n=1 Tax=Ramlibacter sp. WS9 TaxID=1882741 RepID=UPI001141C3E0|nr:OmpW family outer membrane protein [Ramlibacter sp. WS9]ROZ77682.1 OmpW family protein [Ramlibacter sp. WS9]
MKPCARTGVLALAAILAPAAAVAAQPAETGWWLHAGVGQVTFHDSSTLSIAGSVVPGAGAKASDNTAAVFELGYRFTPAWSASATFGVPPTSTVTGTGAAAPLGKVGEVQYGPLVLGAQYHFSGTAIPPYIRPYLGAGAVYYIVTRSKDGALQQLDVKNGWGSALQAGAEFPLSDRYGLFLDVKKIFLKTKATGVLPAAGGAPAKAETTLNPVLVHAGMYFNF